MNRVSDNYADGLETRIKELIEERDALAAKLAEIEGQAPIAYGWFGSDGHIRDCISPETHEVIEGQYDAPLYLAPGANPDKQDAELWRAYQARKQKAINAGMGRNPLREERSAFDTLPDDYEVN